MSRRPPDWNTRRALGGAGGWVTIDSPAVRAVWKKMRADGVSAATIAAIYGCPTNVVRRALRDQPS